MNTSTGGLAFPHEAYGPNLSQWIAPGMTLRDYFAAKAMQGLLAQSQGSAPTSDLEFGAKYAYKMADAMLAERSK